MNPIRPKTFEDYPGQEGVVANLKVYTLAARLRGQMLDHCLFHGPPGLGKTTLAGVIAHEMGCSLKVVSGPSVERPGDLVGVLVSLEPNTVLFVDEIHRLNAHVEEVLYTALEDARIDVLVGQGNKARPITFELPEFTLIGATTRAGALSAPLRDRFGIVEHLEFYSEEALSTIVTRAATLRGLVLSCGTARHLARRSRGTPRIAQMLLKRVADFALVLGHDELSPETVETALSSQGIDQAGLTRKDRQLLRILRDRYAGGPVGLESLASALNEERSTLEDVYEPYLVHQGLILRSGRGRVLSREGRKHLARCKEVAFRECPAIVDSPMQHVS